MLNSRGIIQDCVQTEDQAQSLQLLSLYLLMFTRSDEQKPLPLMNSHPNTIEQFFNFPNPADSDGKTKPIGPAMQ
jgi:hypothetical protein